MANEIQSPNSRGGLATAVASFIQDLSTARRTMILTDIDRGYRQALRRFDWPQALRYVEGINLAASSPFFFVPKDVTNVLRLLNSTTPNVLLERSLADFADVTSGFTSIAGLPAGIAQAGDSAINVTLATNTPVEILSDGTDVRVGFLEGILSNQRKRTSITLNGTTPVALGNWDEITAFYLTTISTLRTVTLRTVSGATTLATIAPQELRSVYKRYRLWPVPTQATSFTALCRYGPPMINDETHEFIIPIADYLFEFAVGKSFESRRQFSPGMAHLQQAENVLLQIWLDSRGHRTEQYIPSSPYASHDNNFYTPVLGSFL